MKVINYNIWDGFKDISKKELFVSYMIQESPDIAAIQELCHFREKDFAQLANDYGHPHAVILKEEGYPVGLSSKYPIQVIHRQIDQFWHGFLHCQVNHIHFIVIHLAPEGCDNRFQEMEKILRYLKERKVADAIILGDFNAHAPSDRSVLLSRPQLLQEYSERNLKNGFFDFSVLHGFLTSGYVDSFYQCNPESLDQWSFPTPALNLDGELESVGERIDFQLCSESLSNAIVSSEIVVNNLTDQISDHYPLRCEYRITLNIDKKL